MAPASITGTTIWAMAPGEGDATDCTITDSTGTTSTGSVRTTGGIVVIGV
jgi:hypothetical protein